MVIVVDEMKLEKKGTVIRIYQHLMIVKIVARITQHPQAARA